MRDEITIHLRFDPPPIPIRSFDWSAVTDDYEPGCPIGHGLTPAEALLALLDALEIYGEE